MTKIIYFKNKAKLIQKYQLYMDEVIANSANFYEMKDLIKRYDTLVATNVKLFEKDEKNQEIISAKKAQLAKYKHLFFVYITFNAFFSCIFLN